MPVSIETAKVYRGGNRRYLTLRSAIQAEARKLIETKYPREKASHDANGQQYDTGWHWRELQRSDVLFRRVCRLVKKSIKAKATL